MNKDSLGKKIKEIRKAKKLTQAQLAELAGVNEKHISKIEIGVYFPTFTTLSKILKALDLNIEDLDFNSKINNKSPFYFRALEILNNAENEAEIEMYYNILNQLQCSIKHFYESNHE